MYEAERGTKFLSSATRISSHVLGRHWTESSHFSTESAGRSVRSEVSIPREKTP